MGTFFNYILLAISVSCMLSCSKDLGNYRYQDINELSFKGLDTVNGYSVYFGDTLQINPSLVGTLDEDASKHAYSYEWSLNVANSSAKDSVISTARDLNVKVGGNPGNYLLKYRVTDQETGVMFHIQTTLQVTTEVYEGYLILNDVEGKSRLDMLSFNKAAQSFTQFTDVLAKMGSSLPQQGEPYQVFCSETAPNGLGSAATYHIYILTASSSSRVNSETFDYLPTYDLRYEMLGALPPDFKGLAMSAQTQFIFTNLFLFADQNLYVRAFISSSAWPYVPVNTYSSSQLPFPVAPYVATDGNAFVLYNMAKHAFVSAPSITAVTMADMPAALNYPTGNDLIYMERNYSGNAYAILKEPGTAKRYMLRFQIGSAPNYYEEITGTDIGQASHYAVSPDLGYLFYSVGAKLYEYDLSLRRSKLMLDKGNAEITYLAFQNFLNRTSNATYGNWAKLLSVGSYNPSGPAASSGTFEQYTVPTVNGDLVRINSWSGFGKIVSTSYRERL